jgi:hypothetical protein
VSASPFSLGTRILGGGAVILMVFLLVGLLLPTDWEAEASRVIPATPEAVLAYLDSPEGWQQWTPWPESGVERSGPDRGEGAKLAWDDPDLGTGSLTLGATSPARVEYEVDVGEGAMRTTGVVTVAPVPEGVRVTWREEGDLGQNPLMGYWAISMGRAQSEELSKGLQRLDSLVSGSAPSR